jgi:hypothetical protein
MVYKFFNTFIDDVFSFLVDMPLSHRLACFRDDFIFFIFLYQLWLYPTDKTRANEYGIAYDDGDDSNKIAKDACASRTCHEKIAENIESSIVRPSETGNAITETPNPTLTKETLSPAEEPSFEVDEAAASKETGGFNTAR